LPLGGTFSSENGPENVRLCGPVAEKLKVQKAGFLPQKTPVPAAKNAENGALLAYPEPEILLIEVAYF
jgi:hypothetical protein